MNEPLQPLQVAADHALEVFTSEVELLGGAVEQVMLVAHCDGFDPGAVLAGHGTDDPIDLFHFLLNATIGVGDSLGLEVRLVGGIGGQG